MVLYADIPRHSDGLHHLRKAEKEIEQFFRSNRFQNNKKALRLIPLEAALLQDKR